MSSMSSTGTASLSSGSSGDSDSQHSQSKSRNPRFVETYELGRTLGSGHFATVKLARRGASGPMCALKIVEYTAVASPRQQDLFRREVAALQVMGEHKQ